VFLRNLLLSNLLVLSFLSLSKELIIDYLDKNASKIEVVSKEINLEILKDVNLFCWTTKTSLRYFKIITKLKDSKSKMLLK